MIGFDVDSSRFTETDFSVTNGIGASIRGDTLLLGEVFAYCKVRIYEKSSGRFIQQVTSDKNGKFKVIGLIKDFRYSVVCVPINGENSKIFDDVVAI